MTQSLTKAFCLLCFCLLPLCAHAERPQPGGDAPPDSISTPQEPPSLLVVENTHDFGEIPLDAEIAHDFEVRNFGSESYEIMKVAVS